MRVAPTYPGVYIEERPSAVHTISGVSTSVTAFVGYTTRGPLNAPVTVTGFADYERTFGGLAAVSPLSYGVYQFFLNGGATAIVVRLAPGAVSASAAIEGRGGRSFTVTAVEPGLWGDGLRVAVDPSTTTDAFDLRVFDATGALSESYRGLSADSEDPRFIPSVVNPSSAVIQVEVTTPGRTPNLSGTVSAPIATPPPDVADQTLDAASGDETHTITLYQASDPKPQTPAQLAVLLEARIRAASPRNPAFAGASVKVVGRRLQLLAGQPSAAISLIGPAATTLGLQASSAPATTPLSGGADGSPPGVADFVGSADAKTGLFALADIPDLNLLVIPELAAPVFDQSGQRAAVIAQASRLCEDKRAFFIIDSPQTWTSVARARAGLAEFDAVRHDHAALYFPHILLGDPLTGQLRTFPSSGAIAGVYARVDSARGVWKAPAGTETALSGVQALSVPLTDAENGLLNPLGVNVLRTFPIVGTVVWGARTLEGADDIASQWKYIPVRRLALFLEESLYRGTAWVVFEANDEPLWSQIRLNVGAFMNTLFLRGAFQGASAREAFLVKCDRTTTTQDDINRGVVNIVVGFAPLKPAEFVILQIQQMTGQVQA